MAFESANNVLCVNDNDITLFVLKRTLTKANFGDKIAERKDGRQALNYCQQFIDNNNYFSGDYPKLIFLDLHMPVMDGWEFLDKFSKDIWPYFPETKIVITSQSVDARESEKARIHPFVIDFLKHPISVAYLLELHKSLLEGYSIYDRN